MRLFMILSMVWVAVTACYSATTLISHQGSILPTTEGWNLVGTSTNVTAYAVQDAGQDAWRIEDPGVINGTNSKGASLYYERLLDPTERSQAHTLGWSLSAKINVPSNYPTTGINWVADSNTWLGFAYDFPETSAPNIERHVFALLFGRTTAGLTRVQLYNPGSPSVYIDLESGFHEYRMDFDPTTQMASVYINGNLWKEYTGYISINSAAGVSRLYWGDNSNQSTAGAWRAGDYASVEMAIAPEPTNSLLMTGGIIGLILRRRRTTI